MAKKPIVLIVECLSSSINYLKDLEERGYEAAVLESPIIPMISYGFLFLKALNQFKMINSKRKRASCSLFQKLRYI